MFYNTVGIKMTEIPARLYIFSSYFKRKQNICKKPPSMVGPSHLRGRSPLLRGQAWFFFLFCSFSLKREVQSLSKITYGPPTHGSDRL